MAPNPLERFFDLGDVEMVKPKSTNGQQQPEFRMEAEEADKDRNDDDVEIENPFLRQEIAEKTVQDVEKIRKEEEEKHSNSVHGFDFEDILRDNFDGPRLPEEGLKSRHRNPPVYIMREEMCSRSSEHM